ncbi:ribokinase [Microbacterium sp. MC2]
MSAPRVIVVGSINADLTFLVHRLPVAGETVVADATHRSSGGKGANQAYAAARSSRAVDVRMAGAVGNDEDGRRMRAELRAAGVDVSGIREVDEPSGVAMIAVDPEGANLIVVAPGANHAWPRDIDLGVASGDVVVLQLELPLDIVAEVTRQSHEAGATVVLNAAPVMADAARLLPFVDVLLVNDGEARELLGLASLADADVAAAAVEHSVDIVITLGSEGSLVAPRAGTAPVRQAAFAVSAVDTVGAGDAFVGALAGALAAGHDLQTAARRGAAAGALTVTVRGARHPQLTPDAIDDFLRRTTPHE